ncbi:MAG: DUF1565 domain-containing protein, partial [Myxococcales bacterium]|nr:DUF1565 domain-containing protein [Myxococcales bacterium]
MSSRPPLRSVTAVHGPAVVPVLLAALVCGAGCAEGGDHRPPPAGGDAARDAAGEGGSDAGRPCRSDEDCPDDGVYCNGGSACREGICVPTEPPSCNDGVGCTRDECLAATDACQNTPVDSACPAGTRCFAGSGCMVAPACEFDSDCASDGVVCNGDEVCVDGMCRSPGTRPCTTENSCAVAECVEARGGCVETVPEDVRSNPMRCGTGTDDCVVCPAPPDGSHQRAVCREGRCGLECEAGWGDADADPSNGCECAIRGADDVPDPDFVDSNCDGIDGDVAIGVFVAPAAAGGNDAHPGTRDRPVATLARAIEIARTAGRARREVYVSAGTYPGPLRLESGVSLYGGYDASRRWRRDRTTASEIRGGTTAVLGDGLTADLELQLLHVQSDAATEAGDSSYGIRIVNSTALVTMRLLTVRSSAGAAGADGPSGRDGENGSDGARGHDGCNGCSGFPCPVGTCTVGGASACARGGDGGTGGYEGESGRNGSNGADGSVSGRGGAGGGGGAAAPICFERSQQGQAGHSGGAGTDGANAPAPTSALGSVVAG